MTTPELFGVPMRKRSGNWNARGVHISLPGGSFQYFYWTIESADGPGTYGKKQTLAGAARELECAIVRFRVKADRLGT